jgi:hypothetical protein
LDHLNPRLLVAVAAVYQNVYKPGELWITYRQTLEALKRERALYDARAGSYRKTEHPLELFAERCENIIAQETSRFGAKDEEQEEQK